MRNHTYRLAALLAILATGAAALSVWLFPRAFPTVALEQHVTRQIVLQRADSFFAANALAPAHAQTSIRFRSHEGLLTFVDLAGGGDDTLNALVRGRDVTPFDWSVRAFLPGDVHEARVDFAPDGRIVGFSRTLAEADARPTVSVDSGEVLARQLLTVWLGEPASRWTLATTSYTTQKTSGRVDRTYTFERVGRQVAGAPIRLNIEIDGDTPAGASPYVEIPDTFSRRYAQMRSANDALELAATLGILAIVLAGAWVFRNAIRERRVRWRGPLVVGAIIAVLLVASGLNDLPGSWYDYDTATSATIFIVMGVLEALAGGLAMGAVVALTLAAAESTERLAFPWHPDWWKLWANRGSRAVAGRVAGGYAVAAIDFAYVALFYVVTRHVLGWWVPSELLDDPNQIATPMPWITGIASSLQAGVWEEALFRALPLSVLALWVGNRPRRRWWLAGGVVVSALIFGFAHANYESWPPYSRGAEIFLDACLWGVIFLRFGILVTVVAHFTYDLVLFALFTASGNALPYRVAGGVMLAALLAPAIAVAWRWVKQRGLRDLGDDARMAAWVPGQREEPAPTPALVATVPLDERWRAIALLTIAAGAIAAIIAPRAPVLGPDFTTTRARAEAVADSTLQSRGIATAGWKKLTTSAITTLDEWPRFLRANHAPALAESLARTYEVPAWWVVRYVHVSGPTAARAEEWRIRVFPDGSLLDVHRIVPDSAHGDSLTDAAARTLAKVAMASAGLDTTRLVEAKLEETPRPSRRDVDITYTDTTVKLPATAAARVLVTLAGSEPLLVRREVELPEAFERADRQQQDRFSAIRTGSGLALFVALTLAAMLVMRRQRPMTGDDQPGRRALIVVGTTFAALAVANALNALPETLYQYDTATPWSTFVSTTAVSVMLSALSALLILALWLLMDGLRRRVGIPLFPATAEVNDGAVAGAALGVLFVLPGLIRGLLSRTTVPAPPATQLDRTMPAIAQVLGIPLQEAGGLLGTAILVLLIVALSRRTWVRVLIGLGVCALAAGLTANEAERFGASGILWLAVTVCVELALLVVALRTWGARSVWSWGIAALTVSLLGTMSLVVHAATSESRASALIAAVAAGVTLVLWLRWGRRRSTDRFAATTP
jgi:hypothetical protein